LEVFAWYTLAVFKWYFGGIQGILLVFRWYSWYPGGIFVVLAVFNQYSGGILALFKVLWILGILEVFLLDSDGISVC